MGLYCHITHYTVRSKFNSLVWRKHWCKSKCVIFKYILVIDIFFMSCDICRLMPQDPIEDKSPMVFVNRDHFVHAPSQWETTLHCNVVSHWLGACKKLSLMVWINHQATSHYLKQMLMKFNDNSKQYEIKFILSDVSHELSIFQQCTFHLCTNPPIFPIKFIYIHMAF